MSLTIVTGGGRGIGAATALHLARAGHDVVVNYRRRSDEADRVVAAARQAGVRAVAVAADVVDPSDVDRLFAAAAELGAVTGLVNSAGLTKHIGDLADTPVEIIREVIDVNLFGSILCARKAAQVMSTRRGGQGGAIVNISSAAGTTGSPHEYVQYAAAKAGIDILTLGLSKELAGDGIRVNAVAPGIVRTEIHADAGAPDRPDRAAGRIPLGRPGEPEEIAPAIAFLLRAESSYTTGAVLRVAGGL
ncbi:MAG TPA: SDR family oxidoreductase [Mycobacteriales bacterium]|jgi:glucose 1-dehydrogenase